MTLAPSPAQRRLLEKMTEGATVAWIGGMHPWTFLNTTTNMVPIRTVMVLRDRGWIEQKGQPGYGRYNYAISAAGREALERTKPLPTPDALYGSDPDFTNGVESTEYLHQMRARRSGETP